MLTANVKMIDDVRLKLDGYEQIMETDIKIPSKYFSMSVSDANRFKKQLAAFSCSLREH